jgi:uncharacterized protein YjbI with pentapeptide repeats|tara:strand:- start:236 stop:463 length:228 start_codon:yes stop_codon:yes gene_type:complete
MQKSEFLMADLSFYDLRGVDMARADLRGVKLKRANLRNANLVGVVFSLVNVSSFASKGEWRTNLGRTNLIDVKFK